MCTHDQETALRSSSLYIHEHFVRFVSQVVGRATGVGCARVTWEQGKLFNEWKKASARTDRWACGVTGHDVGLVLCGVLRVRSTTAGRKWNVNCFYFSNTIEILGSGRAACVGYRPFFFVFFRQEDCKIELVNRKSCQLYLPTRVSTEFNLLSALGGAGVKPNAFSI